MSLEETVPVIFEICVSLIHSYSIRYYVFILVIVPGDIYETNTIWSGGGTNIKPH